MHAVQLHIAQVHQSHRLPYVYCHDSKLLDCLKTPLWVCSACASLVSLDKREVISGAHIPISVLNRKPAVYGAIELLGHLIHPLRHAWAASRTAKQCSSAWQASLTQRSRSLCLLADDAAQRRRNRKLQQR